MSLLQRLELNFWQITIPLIQESEFARFVFTRLYSALQKRLVSRFLLPAMLSVALGLSLGFILGTISRFW